MSAEMVAEVENAARIISAWMQGHAEQLIAGHNDGDFSLTATVPGGRNPDAVAYSLALGIVLDIIEGHLSELTAEAKQEMRSYTATFIAMNLNRRRGTASRTCA